jgi:hypothetical protein
MINRSLSDEFEEVYYIRVYEEEAWTKPFLFAHFLHIILWIKIQKGEYYVFIKWT